MEENIVYLNGEYIKESEAKLSIFDRGFRFGDGVFDVGRTYNHIPFKLEEHIQRLFRSLCYVQIDPGLTPEEVQDITLEVIKRNEKNWAPNDDYIYGQRISRGEISYLNPAAATRPTVLIECVPIPFKSFAKRYVEGIHLVTTPIRQIPPQCLDPRVKFQSRLVNVMAEREAKKIDPAGYGLMLDINGLLAEGPSYNFFLVKEGILLTSNRNNILEGITRATILGLAKELRIESAEMDLTMYDLYTADEIFITSTNPSILPVSKLNNRPLREPIPGPITKQLLSAFIKLVGIDIVQQALDHV